MPDWLIQLGGYLFAGGMAYGAIRADLVALREKSEAASSSAIRAHERIDEHVTDWHRGQHA